jgi:hypothetical protein
LALEKILPSETAPVRKVVQIFTMVHAEHVRRDFRLVGYGWRAIKQLLLKSHCKLIESPE